MLITVVRRRGKFIIASRLFKRLHAQEAYALARINVLSLPPSPSPRALRPQPVPPDDAVHAYQRGGDAGVQVRQLRLRRLTVARLWRQGDGVTV